MAKVEGENLNFEELTPAEEEAVEADAPIAETVAPPTEAESNESIKEADQEVGEKPLDEEESLEEKSEEEEAEEEPSKLPDYLALAGVVVVLLILLALAWMGYLFISTAIYFVGLVLIPYGLWLGRAKNTVYTVFLGCVAVALLTAVYFLWVEIGRYNFDPNAQEAKQRVGLLISAPADRYV